MPNYITNSNAAASVGGGARGKYASAQRNVHLGKHNIGKRIVLYILVSAREIRRYSVSSVQVVG